MRRGQVGISQMLQMKLVTCSLEILLSRFHMSLLERLIGDMKVLAYASLYAHLQLRVAQVDIKVRLATMRIECILTQCQVEVFT